MIGIGAKYSNDETKYMKLAEDITSTCHESYIRTGEFSCGFLEVFLLT